MLSKSIVDKLIIGVAIVAFAILGAGVFQYAHSEPLKPSDRIVIKDDFGGVYDEYQAALIYLRDKQRKIKLDGKCESACTAILSSKLKLDLCVTKNAQFGIHHPVMMFSNTGLVDYTLTSVYLADKLWQEGFYQVYPPWVKTIIDRAGGAPDVYTGAKQTDVLWIKYDDMKNNLKTCED